MKKLEIYLQALQAGQHEKKIILKTIEELKSCTPQELSLSETTEEMTEQMTEKTVENMEELPDEVLQEQLATDSLEAAEMVQTDTIKRYVPIDIRV